jgi:hypothetical protein
MVEENLWLLAIKPMGSILDLWITAEVAPHLAQVDDEFEERPSSR